ncbi:thioredoxin family protein [Adhaeribacter sp. BT258]|uniref:Thioredoxin family protein n=1 Tax=Adhaeribacter terrigena TaxID=2793070 RepID=A0ABS1BZQ6_9BACT|nr:thioredoxin family protein [Adhaeribacter terrigena]MBK0402397.1 thioredoxin family protein [Adhaeribacter terrigena]
METTFEIKPTLENPLTYNLYAVLIEALVAAGQTTGPEQTEEKIAFTKLNAQRSKRVHRTFEMLPELRETLQHLPEKWEWLLITESWCGDGAQLVPAIAEIAAATPNIELSILLRDENPELMDLYLTNGGRAIPKLICLNAETDETLFAWGPRPEAIQQKVKEFKTENPYAGKEELHQQLAVWYAKDKSITLQRDMLNLIKKATFCLKPVY